MRGFKNNFEDSFGQILQYFEFVFWENWSEKTEHLQKLSSNAQQALNRLIVISNRFFYQQSEPLTHEAQTE